MSREYVEALRRHSLELQDLQGAHAEEFLRLLKELKTNLEGRLVSMGGLQQDFDVFKVRAVVGETEAGILTLEKKAAGNYNKAAQESVDLAIEHLGTELDTLSAAFDPRPLDVTLDAAKALADPAQQLLANHFDSSVRRYGLDLLNGTRQRIFVGLRTGDPFGDVVKDVAGEQGPFGQVGRANAERLVRTETSQAYGAAQHSGVVQAAKQAPSLKKVWIHVGSWLCPTCGPLHGTERPINGTWTIRQGSRTREVAHAPAHPNCGCRVASMKPKWRQGLQKLGYLGDQPATGDEGAARL